MAKLYSLPIELRTLRGLCDARKLKRHGYLMSRISDECFHTEEAREIFNAIRSYVAQKGQPPSFHLLCETPNVTREAREVFRDAPAAPDTRTECDDVIDQLHTLRKTRQAYRMARSVLEALEGKKLDLEKVASLIAEGQASISISHSLDDSFFHVGRDANTLGLVDELLNGESADDWIPTTWKTFDTVNGGLPRGGLVAIGAASGAGKSHTVLHLAKAQAQLGYKTVVVPLEMTESEQLARFLANATGLDSLRINLKKLAEEERAAAYRKFKRINRKIEDAGGRFTIFRPREDLSIEETLNACHSFNPDIIYIDYIGLLKGADGEDQWRKLGQIARYGKVYAGNTNKIVCMAAQVGDDGRIRYSQAIKEHASLAFIMSAQRNLENSTGILNVNMLKGRNQQTMNFNLFIDYKTSQVRDVEPGELQDTGNPTPPPGKPTGSSSSAGSSRKKGSASSDSYVPDLSE